MQCLSLWDHTPFNPLMQMIKGRNGLQIQKVRLIATKSNVWFNLRKFLFILRTTPF